MADNQEDINAQNVEVDVEVSVRHVSDQAGV